MDSSWPVALGVLVAPLIAWLSHRSRFRLAVAVPAGDLLVLVSYLAGYLLRIANWFAGKWLPVQRRPVLTMLQSERSITTNRLATSKMEARLSRWRMGIGFYLLIAIALAAMMLALP